MDGAVHAAAGGSWSALDAGRSSLAGVTRRAGRSQALGAVSLGHHARVSGVAQRPRARCRSRPIDQRFPCTKAGARRSTSASLPGFKEAFGEALQPETRVPTSPRRTAPTTRCRSSTDLAAMPHTLVHFDYRADNLMFDADGSVAVVDWADDQPAAGELEPTSATCSRAEPRRGRPPGSRG